MNLPLDALLLADVPAEVADKARYNLQGTLVHVLASIASWG